MNSPSPRSLRSTFSLAKLGGADAGLAIVVVVVVALMVVPLPTWLLDILLATNLSAAVAILLVVLYVPDALSIATFPTLLLITTLFRLALNVSSTRLILLQANAGEVIRAFGPFVVRGNYVVGAVVFLILTIIQFIVIAKGSERVAEVGARFVLDAMPGKQMAIDAEVALRRHRRQRGAPPTTPARRARSQFYGAMDGAMKFVKGDVIASLDHHRRQHPRRPRDRRRAAGHARRRLRSSATACSPSATAWSPKSRRSSSRPRPASSSRASPAKTPTPRSGASSQASSSASPRRFGSPGSSCWVSARCRGCPWFLSSSSGSLLLGGRARSRTQHLVLLHRASASEPQRREATGPRRGPGLPSAGHPVVHRRERRSRRVARRRHARRAGTALGRVRAPASASASASSPTSVSPSPPPAFAPPIPYRRTISSSRSSKFPRGCSRSRTEHREDAIGTLEASAPRAAALPRRRLRRHRRNAAPARPTRASRPALVRQTVPKPVTLSLLADVLRRMVEEQVSIRDLRAILEALSTVAPSEKDPLNLTEFVRGHLRRATTYRLTGGRPELSVCLLDGNIEEAIRHAITRTAAGSFLTLAPAHGRDVVAAVRRALAQVPSEASRIVILTQPDIRRFVRKLVEVDFPEVTVVSFAELLPEISLRPLAKATLAISS